MRILILHPLKYKEDSCPINILIVIFMLGFGFQWQQPTMIFTNKACFKEIAVLEIVILVVTSLKISKSYLCM
jgi:hypothetical protein